MVSGLESVTVAVEDIDAALAVLHENVGLRIETDTRASVSLLSAWRCPVHTDVRLVELSAKGNPLGRVRLARFESAAPFTARADSGSHPPGRPADVGAKAQDFQVGTSIERALRALHVTPSIATADLEASRRFCREGLGVAPDLLPLVDATTAEPGQPMAPGQLGVNLFSLRCDDLDALEAKLRPLDVEIVTRPTHVALGNGAPARIMLVRGPNFELLEFIERSE